MWTFPNDPREYFDLGVHLSDPRLPDLVHSVPGWAEDQIKAQADPTSPQGELKSARYQDRLWYRSLLPHAEGPQWYPLARFDVGRGEIGFIYNIQTQINGFGGDPDRIWYRNADPISWLYEIPLITPEAAPVWRLVIENRNPRRTRRPRRIQAFTPGPLPVHPDLQQWADGRFVPNGDNYRLKLMIPEGKTARLWLGLPIPTMLEANTPRFASSRLIGFTQSWSDNEESRYNARRAW